MSRPNSRSAAPLVIGLILILLGGLFLTVRLVDFDFGWGWLRFILPGLLLTWGVFKLVRHFLLDVQTLVDRPGKSGLLSGLFWSGAGLIWLLDLLGVLEGFSFIGIYWPLLLILFGLGKIVDYYRSQGRLQVRVAELFGVVFVVFFGLGCGLVAEAQFPLLRLPSLEVGGSSVSIDELFSRKYAWTEEESMAAEGVARVEIDNLYGDVVVQADSSGNIQVELTKAILASSEAEARKIAQEVRLTLERDGDLVRVSTNRKELQRDKKLFKSHLRLRVPPQLPQTITNRYGDVRVQGLESGCAIRNSYGDVLLEDATGGCEVTNQYRRVTLRRVEGDVKITNDRGAVAVEDGTGDLRLETAYDSVTVRRQDGDVEIKNRFGSVSLSSVNGQVTVESPGSEVSAAEIEGALTLNASHKSVTIRDVEQGVTLDTSSNRVSLTRIGGPVRIQAAYSDVQANELEAGLRIEAKGTRVSVEDLEGGFDISTSTRPVRIVHFGGGGTVQNEYGQIEAVAERPLDGDLSLSTKNAPITLVIPENTAARISAQAPGGRIHSEFARESTEDEAISVLDTELSQGGPMVRLQTTYSPIYIKKSR